MKNSTAFSLIEILLVVTIIGILVIPLYLSYTRTQANQGLRSTSEQLADTLTQAHIFAREARDKKAWGVQRSSDTVFSLVSGSASSSAVVMNKSAEPGVTFPDDFSVWFDIGTGELSAAKSVKVQNRYGARKTIEISKTGLVEVNNEDE